MCASESVSASCSSWSPEVSCWAPPVCNAAICESSLVSCWACCALGWDASFASLANSWLCTSAAMLSTGVQTSRPSFDIVYTSMPVDFCWTSTSLLAGLVLTFWSLASTLLTLSSRLEGWRFLAGGESGSLMACNSHSPT